MATTPESTRKTAAHTTITETRTFLPPVSGGWHRIVHYNSVATFRFLFAKWDGGDLAAAPRLEKRRDRSPTLNWDPMPAESGSGSWKPPRIAPGPLHRMVQGVILSDR